MSWENPDGSVLVRIFGCNSKLRTDLQKRVTVALGISEFKGTGRSLEVTSLPIFQICFYSVLAPSPSRTPSRGGKIAARSFPFASWPLSIFFQENTSSQQFQQKSCASVSCPPLVLAQVMCPPMNQTLWLGRFEAMIGQACIYTHLWS